MALFVGLDVSLNTTSMCLVEAKGKVVWEGKALSEPVALLKTLAPWRKKIKLIGIEACPLSEWLYGALVESKLETVCIETPAPRAPAATIATRMGGDAIGRLRRAVLTAR